MIFEVVNFTVAWEFVVNDIWFIKNTSCWLRSLLRILCRDYVNKFKPENATFEHLITNKTYFKEKFTQFLFSPKGGIYQVVKYFTYLNLNFTYFDLNFRYWYFTYFDLNLIFSCFIFNFFSPTFGFRQNWFAASQLRMFNSKQFLSSINASSGA